MIKRIKIWWNKERVDRIEKDTSQDSCPRNGDVIFMYLWFLIPSIVFLLLFIFGAFKNGIR